MAQTTGEQIFADMTLKWERLRDQKHFSAPAELGSVAILCSHWTKLQGNARKQEIRLLSDEADALAELFCGTGRRVELCQDARWHNIAEAIADPWVSDVQLIGHGNFSSITIPGRDELHYFGWREVARTANHLKLGHFVQRICGLYSMFPAVPLGLFATADPRNIWASGGKTFEPQSLDDPINALLQPVTTQPGPLSYEYVTKTYVGGEQPGQGPEFTVPGYIDLAAALARLPF